MTQKRFIKLLMGRFDVDARTARMIVRQVHNTNKSYNECFKHIEDKIYEGFIEAIKKTE